MVSSVPSGRADSLLSNAGCRAVMGCEYGFATMGMCTPRDRNVNTVVIH